MAGDGEARGRAEVRERLPQIPYRAERLSPEQSVERGRSFFERLDSRRSVRDYASTPVPRGLIETAIRAASTAPSGAHRQPWRFVAVSDPALKARIREAAEEEERVNYLGGRMPDDWLDAVAPLGTDWRKPHLEDAPWLVVVFAELYGLDADGAKRKNYYVKESVGIACGLFIAALHDMGLATLTHTPSPMDFLARILSAARRTRRLSSSSPSAIRRTTPRCPTYGARLCATSPTSSPPRTSSLGPCPEPGWRRSLERAQPARSCRG